MGEEAKGLCDWRNRLEAWRENRRLTTKRAGVTSQRFAAERLDRYVQTHLSGLALSLGALVVICGVVWALLRGRPAYGGVLTGFLFGFGVAFLYHLSVISSGAAGAAMGEAAEQWTDSELRRLRRKGWKHVNHLVITQRGDVDHVAVGPDGVIVVETKWRSNEVDVDELDHSMSKAIRQAKDNCRRVRQLLNWQHRDPQLVQPLVVLWGPEVTHESAEAILTDEEVNVVAGQHLRDELDYLGETRLSAGEVEEVYRALKHRIRVRDDWEAKNVTPSTTTLGEQATRWAWNAGACWGGLYLSLLTARLGWWSLVVLALLVTGGLAARRVESGRDPAAWFIGGVLLGAPLAVLPAIG